VSEVELERIQDVAGAERCDVLFREYGAWSVQRLAQDCGLQLTEGELEAAHASFQLEWPKLFAPKGRMYLALVGAAEAGVGALKPIDSEMAEIKRMYVRPDFRGLGVGRVILQRLVDDARELGYKVARLETLVYMTEAHDLYRSKGFVDAERFEAEGSDVGLAQFELFMELKL
jgi:GNAT superfamily N-acetyltransferase